MKLISKTTVESFFKKEFYHLVKEKSLSLKEYNNGMRRAEMMLRKHDGDLYEYDDETNRGLCIVDSCGAVLTTYITNRK